MISGGRYASGGDYTLAFAARADWSPYKLQVTWRDGRVTEVDGVEANQLYIISETNTVSAPQKVASAILAGVEPGILPGGKDLSLPAGQPQSLAGQQSARSSGRQDAALYGRPEARRYNVQPLFEDVSAALSYTNYENIFNDFEAQPLLPYRMSRLGPGVSWFDIDGDGLDDLIVGAPAGGWMGMFKNLGAGKFELLNAPDKQIHVRHDQTTVLGLGAKTNGVALVIGVSTWEDPASKTAMHFISRDAGGDWQVGANASRGNNVTGPLALADVDRDGNLDLFLGGRARAGRYPAAADSMIVLRDGAGHLVEATVPALKNLGLVTSAVFADLNGDGRPDLIAGCEWGAIQILINTGQGFTNATAAWGLDKFTGWWNGVAVGDFDGDGRIDFVASNWGENTKYEESWDSQRPLRIYYGDLNEMNRMEIIEAHEDAFTHQLVPERDLNASAAAVPYIRGNTPTHQMFGESGLAKIYGEKLKTASMLEARELRSMVFLNRGGKFEAKPLPVEAQLAPAFGISVADFDGDGNDDIFLAQNFFSSQPETVRNDAGRGLLLLGDGKGNFRALSGEESGIKIYGEQRGSAVSDYDGDGRVDLVVAQSRDETKLLHNRRARPGLRVKLVGGPGNPQCVGAILRAKTAAGLGRAQVVTAGSGYWSQDSATLVVTSASPITALQVQWPDGSTTEQPVAPDATAVTIRSQNKSR